MGDRAVGRARTRSARGGATWSHGGAGAISRCARPRPRLRGKPASVRSRGRGQRVPLHRKPRTTSHEDSTSLYRLDFQGFLAGLLALATLTPVGAVGPVRLSRAAVRLGPAWPPYQPAGAFCQAGPTCRLSGAGRAAPTRPAASITSLRRRRPPERDHQSYPQTRGYCPGRRPRQTAACCAGTVPSSLRLNSRPERYGYRDASA